MTVHTPTGEELRKQRRDLVAQLRIDEDEMRKRLESYQLTPSELETLRRIDDIDYLLAE